MDCLFQKENDVISQKTQKTTQVKYSRNNNHRTYLCETEEQSDAAAKLERVRNGCLQLVQARRTRAATGTEIALRTTDSLQRHTRYTCPKSQYKLNHAATTRIGWHSPSPCRTTAPYSALPPSTPCRSSCSTRTCPVPGREWSPAPDSSPPRPVRAAAPRARPGTRWQWRTG